MSGLVTEQLGDNLGAPSSVQNTCLCPSPVEPVHTTMDQGQYHVDHLHPQPGSLLEMGCVNLAGSHLQNFMVTREMLLLVVAPQMFSNRVSLCPFPIYTFTGLNFKVIEVLCML